MKRLLFIITFLLATASLLVAQTPSFDVVQPRNVVEGNRFSLTFSLQNASGNITPPKAPALDGCTVLYGPATSTMQSYQVVNGVATSSASTDYTFTYRADKAGTVTVPAVSITADGKHLSSRQTSFTILPPDKSQQNQQAYGRGGAQVPQQNRQQSSDFNVGKDDVIVRIILSRSQAYEQEALECTIKLYTKYNISSFMPKTQPSFDGFLIEDLNVQAYLGEREHYNGSNYYTAVLKRCLLYPQRNGKLTINSGQYDLTVIRQIVINDWPFPRTVEQEHNIQVNSNSASVNVLPLPQPQPAGFNGAVGHFSIDSRIVGNNFRTNEAATMIHTISGTGNIKYLKEPAIDFPSEFELYSPRIENNARVSGNNMTGTMTAEYTFVPQSVGKFKIGADKFVYFDPAKKDYVTLTTPEYEIDVKQGVSAPSSSGTGADKQDIKAKNTDILHIKLGDKNPQKQHSFIINSWWYWTLYIILALALAGTIMVTARNMKAAADTTGRKLARANKVAKKRLKIAGDQLRQQQYDKFYEELLKALWGYLSDKLSLPASQLSRDNIAAILKEYGTSSELIDKLMSVIDECEMSRYTPQLSSEQAETVFNQASTVINDMESIKRNR